MEPVASGASNKIDNSILQLQQQIEENGSVSISFVPPLSAKKKKSLDKTSHDFATVNKKLKKSDPTASENFSDLHICHEIITIEDNLFINSNMNLTENDRDVQPENIADNANDTSTNVKARIPSPELLATSEVETKGGSDTKESQSCSRSSILNNFSSDVKTGDPSFKPPSSSETQSVQTCEGRLSEEKEDISLKNSCENKCPVVSLDLKVTCVSENSDHQLPQYVITFCHLSNCSKEVENIAKRSVSSVAVPRSGMVEKGKQQSGSSNTFHSTSASPENSRSEKRCQKYSLRTSRKQPIRYVNVEPQVRHTKVTKTQRKRTIKITLSNSAENSLLTMFHELATFHGCEVTVDGKTMDVTKMQIARSLFGAAHLRHQDFSKCQQGSNACFSQHSPTAFSFEKKVQATHSQTGLNLEKLKEKLQLRGSRLEVTNKSDQNGSKAIENSQIFYPHVILDVVHTNNSD